MQQHEISKLNRELASQAAQNSAILQTIAKLQKQFGAVETAQISAIGR
jgi:hypothetical protein